MKPVQSPLSHSMLCRRIDEMGMSISDRELAKARLLAGERLADAICEGSVAIRSYAALVARQVRTAIAASPQH